MTRRYNLKNIRTLLTEGFTEQELRGLCYYEHDFKPIYEEMAQTASKAQIIDNLIEYAEKKVLLDTILAFAKENNPIRFEEYQPYYISPSSSIAPNQTKFSNPTHSHIQRLKQRQKELQGPLSTYNRRLEALQADIARELNSERRVILEERFEEVSRERDKIQTELETIELQLSNDK